MSSLILDIVISLLLLVAVGFGAISVIGLLLFPDIRSRSFTGLRAGMLAITLTAISGISFGIYQWLELGGLQYAEFAFGACFLLALTIVLNRIATDLVCRDSAPVIPASLPGDEK